MQGSVGPEADTVKICLLEHIDESHPTLHFGQYILFRSTFYPPSANPENARASKNFWMKTATMMQRMMEQTNHATCWGAQNAARFPPVRVGEIASRLGASLNDGIATTSFSSLFAPLGDELTSCVYVVS